jgi:hypothetical protein
MKRLREILLETNVSAGVGIRGFGDVTGNPATTEDSENSHIERMIQGADEYTELVNNFINNHNSTSMLDEPIEDNWWAKAGAKGSALTALGKPSKSKVMNEGMEAKHYDAIDDVHVNLENRNHAIEEYGYGPLNPSDNNSKFWNEKAELWNTSIDEAKRSRCSNCAAFNKSKEIVNKISTALGPAGKTIVEKADLGFCEMFHFKCAGARTCDAWLNNGPIKEEMGVGGGAIAGAGVDAPGKPGSGEPGVPPKNKYKKKNEEESPVMGKILRRPMLDRLTENTGKFAGHITHKVPHSVFNTITQQKAKGKHWRKYLDDGEHTSHIKEYANRNPKKPIIIEDEKTGYMCFARYGK